MKKTFNIFCFIISVVAITSVTLPCHAADEIDAATQRKVVSQVEKYCQLMKEISGNVENIDKQDQLYNMCENENVSVFNDLVPPSKDMSANSMPLQQYMMLMTEKYENNVKTEFSGYKYVKTIIQPSPLPDFPAAQYAFVKVDKKVSAKGLKSSNHFNILVNVGTMKVSSTISEDYEDPQRIYLEGLEKFNANDYKDAAKLFGKISNLQRYPGRNRAKAMLGWSLDETKQFQKAYDALSESSESGDPLGSVILASKILMSDRVPADMRNSTRGYSLLIQNGNKHDKEMPTMHLIAKTAIIDACFDFLTLKPKLTVPDYDLMKLSDDILSDSVTNDAFNLRAYIAKALVLDKPKKPELLKEALNNILLAEKTLNESTNIEQEEWNKLDVVVQSVKAVVLNYLGETEKAQECYSALMKKPYAAASLASTFMMSGQYETAMSFYRKAAENNDPVGAYIMSLDAFPWLSPDIDKMQYHDYVVIWHNTIMHANTIVQSGIQSKWIRFTRYLLQDSTVTKSIDEYKRLNQKAIELGSVDAMQDRAIHEICGFGYEKNVNIPYGLELACNAASMGYFSTPNRFLMSYSFSYFPPRDGDNYSESLRYKTLKKLYEQGNPAAAYLLYCDYRDIFKDTVQARQYLEECVAANFYPALYEKAFDLVGEKKYDEAYKMAQTMTAFPKSFAYSLLGQIDKDYRHDYKSARKNFLSGMTLEWDYQCAEGLADIYKDGLGVKKNLTTASKRIETATALYKAAHTDSDLSKDEEYNRLVKKKAEIDSLLALEQNAPSGVSSEARLNDVLDASASADERINLSQKVLSELFASSKAVVRTVGSNGKTVVATETAEDFMLRLATMQAGKTVKEISSKKNKDGKLTELTVSLE